MNVQSPTGTSSGVWSGSARSGSVRSPGPSNNDPPRPAKDGFEWVWYPEGYWAERPLEHRRTSKQNSQRSSQSQTSPMGKIFKWSSRQSRSPQDAPEPREPEPSASISPLSQPRPSQLVPQKSLPQSPYLSESAQIAALQHPVISGNKPRGSRDTWTTSNPTSAPNAELLSSGTRLMTDPNAPKYTWMPFHRHRVRT